MSNNVHIDKNSENLKISDAARILGVTTKTLRRWEKKGILTSRRTATGNRIYSAEDLQSLNTPKLGKASNLFPLAITTIILSSFVIFGNGGIKGTGLNDVYDTFSSTEKDVLGVTTGQVLQAQTTATVPEISNFTFTVNVPSKFSEGVTFLKDIVAPNVVNTVGGETGDVELTAGDGISIDGLEITNDGILSLSAGDGISISGSTITNSRAAPDYGLSGWTITGTSVGLTTTTNSVLMDTVTFGNATITNGESFLPDTDVGSDLGSSAKRFNNLWVANINSNSSQAFSGQTTFSYAPTDSTITQASVLINPTTSASNGQLLGLGIAGYQRALIDADGDIILGYNSATSAPATAYPLTIYGHNGTNVSYVDTSGNGYFAGNVSAAGGYLYSDLGLATYGNSNQYLYTSSNGWALNVSASSRDITFGVTGGSELMRIVGTGNVGIGTAVTNYKLDVTGDIHGSTGLYFASSTEYLLATGGYSILNSYYPIIIRTYSTDNPISFAVNSVEKMRIDSTGNVGIGSVSPTSKLHVTGAVTGKALAIFNETGDQALLTASASGTPKFTILHNGLVNATIGVATFTKAGTISDTDFTDAAVNGLMGFDSTNGRLYVRNAGAWSYIAKTAGFQIPDFESEGLSEGDFLIPYVEKKMGDGAVHGLYSKWSDVKNLLLAEVNSQSAIISSQLSEFKNKFITKEICIKDNDDNQTCIKKDQLDELIKLLPTPSSTPQPINLGVQESPSPSATPEPTIEATPTPTPVESPTALPTP